MGRDDGIHLLSPLTGAGDEIGWDFVDRVMKSQITFSGYCDLITNQYKRLNKMSAPFMSVNTFLDWWFSWAGNFKIDFRTSCSLCKDAPRMLACDGTKLGIRLRHSSVSPIEKPTSQELIDPCHRRNERAFFAYVNGDPNTKEKIACREHLRYMCQRVLGSNDDLSEFDEIERTRFLLDNIDHSCKDLFVKFCRKDYPDSILRKLAKVLEVLSTSHSLSSLVPYRFLQFLSETVLLIQTENNPNPTIIGDIGIFSPEIRDALLVLLDHPLPMQDFAALLSYIIGRVQDMFQAVKEPDPLVEQPGT